MKSSAIPVLCLFLSLPASAREFSNARGDKFEAHLHSVDDGRVYFIQENDARKFTLFSFLSGPDQAYVQSWKEGQHQHNIGIRAAAKTVNLERTPKKTTERFNYAISVTNKGQTALENVRFDYTLYIRTIGQNPEVEDRKKRRAAVKGQTTPKNLPPGETFDFESQSIECTSASTAHDLGDQFMLHSVDKNRWKEMLAGIVVETFADDRIIDVFEWQEPTYEFKHNRTWSFKNHPPFFGKLVSDDGDSLHIRDAVKKKNIVLKKADFDERDLFEYERMKERNDRWKAGPPVAGNPGAAAKPPAAPKAAKPRGELHSLKVWTGKNGSEFIGSFMKEEGNLLHIERASDSRILRISKSNLSAKTLAWYENTKSNTINSSPEKVATDAPYQPLDITGLDRGKIPVLNQGDYGTKASDCLPNSYAAFFLWWDQAGKIPIPKGRDFEAKAQWIHRELSRRCGTRNNSGTRYDNATKGIHKYFTEFHQRRFKIHIQEVFDVSPASLAKHAAGANATVLTLSTYRTKRPRRANAGHHAVTLISAREDGQIEIATWGGRLTGKMTPLSEKDIQGAHRGAPSASKVAYEIIFDETSDFPEGFLQQDYRFIIDPGNYNALDVLSVEEWKKK